MDSLANLDYRTFPYLTFPAFMQSWRFGTTRRHRSHSALAAKTRYFPAIEDQIAEAATDLNFWTNRTMYESNLHKQHPNGGGSSAGDAGAFCVMPGFVCMNVCELLLFMRVHGN